MNKVRMNLDLKTNLVRIASVIKLIEEEHENFEDFSIHFGRSTLSDLKETFKKSREIVQDYIYEDLQLSASKELELEMNSCTQLIQRCKFDLDLIFQDNADMWHENDFFQYYKADESAKHMYLFLMDLELISTTHKDQLVELGWTDESFDKIVTYQSRLKNCMNEVNICNINRKRATIKRHIVIRDLQNKLVLYKTAAQIIFKNKPDLINWFNFSTEIDLEEVKLD